MGVVNVKQIFFPTVERISIAINRRLRRQTLQDGADIIEWGENPRGRRASIGGGEGTVFRERRIGAVIQLSADWRRKFGRAIVSVDTYKANVARERLKPGRKS